MEIDHIFIFTANQGREGDQLIDFGLNEGSSRVHPGQGTTNRKFYFENFFLELVWVIDEEEITSELTAPTRLWERSQFHTNGYSPFGLCLVHSEATDPLFANSQTYEPAFFPLGLGANIITNQDKPYLPWTFRLASSGPSKYPNEPRNHPVGLQQLTRATFGIPAAGIDDFVTFFRQHPQVAFETSPKPSLTLEFDHHKQGKSQHFEALGLSIAY
jgi:hypothetical protein